ncbi:hypothetical protein [Viridibacillus arvi]|uniref:hypothetical protein n=1 Tax=Viridibacillus arvi TaxID=263475 RepID=UPI003D0116A5
MDAKKCPDCGSQINEFGIIRIHDNMAHRLCECGFEVATDKEVNFKKKSQDNGY